MCVNNKNHFTGFASGASIVYVTPGQGI